MWHKSGHSTIQLSFSDLQGEREKCLQVQYIVTYSHAWCNFSLHLSIFPLSCWRQPTRVSELLWLWGCSVSLLLWLYSDCREIQLVSQITSETRRFCMLFARDQIGFCVPDNTSLSVWFVACSWTLPTFMLCSCGASSLFESDCLRTVLCVVSQSNEHLSLWIWCHHCVSQCPPNVVWIWFAEIAFMCVFAVQTKNQSGFNLDMP